MKEREKKVFPLHCAIMGFQIIYCTKVITVNFSLCENSAPGPSLSKESGLHREQKKLLVSFFFFFCGLFNKITNICIKL